MKKNEHVWLTNLDIGLRKLCSLPFCSSPVLSVPLLAPCESLRFRGRNNHGRWRKRSLEQRHSLDFYTLDWASFDLILPTPLGLSFLLQAIMSSVAARRESRARFASMGWNLEFGSRRNALNKYGRYIAPGPPILNLIKSSKTCCVVASCPSVMTTSPVYSCPPSSAGTKKFAISRPAE